jgi:hypothetical protein
MAPGHPQARQSRTNIRQHAAARRPAQQRQKQQRPKQVAKRNRVPGEQQHGAEQAAVLDGQHDARFPVGEAFGAGVVKNRRARDRLPQEGRHDFLRGAPDLVRHQPQIAGGGMVVGKLAEDDGNAAEAGREGEAQHRGG